MSALAYLEKADTAIGSARLLLAQGDGEGAANRAYYGTFHAARAALLNAGESAAGKHGAIIGRFSLLFVKNGPLPPDLGRAFQEELST